MLRKSYGNLLHTLAFFLPFGYSLRPFLHKLRGVKIGRNVWISKYVYIDDTHPECVTIGDNTTIGLRTTIFAHVYFGPPRKSNTEKVVIGKNVYIGPHCLILPNVSIGDNAVIKGGTVVSKNIPSGTMWGTPSAELIARVSVPLTSVNSYEEFVQGLRPVKKNI
jgi:acetyltransferase-like isoleucine patch superfamily enzyme